MRTTLLTRFDSVLFRAAFALLAGVALMACGDGEDTSGGGGSACTPGLPGECPAGLECTLVDPINVVFACMPPTTADAGIDSGTPDAGPADVTPSDTTPPNDTQLDDVDGGEVTDDPTDPGGDPDTDTDIPPTEDCGNGADDDGDGATDCDDSDCAALPECTNRPALVAYVVDNSVFDQISVISSDGSYGPHRVEANDNSAQNSPAFSDDGRWLAYTYAQQGDSYVGLLNLETSEREQIRVAGASVYRSPNFSPDGTQVAFTAAPSSQPDQIYIYNLSTETLSSQLTTVVAAPAGQPSPFVASPVFSADGTRLYYLSGIGGNGPEASSDITSMATDGTDVREESTGFIFTGRLMPNPDRSEFVVSVLEAGIYVFNVGNASAAPLPNASSDSGAAFVGAGRVAMSTGPTGDKEIVLRDRATGVVLTNVTNSPGASEFTAAGSSVPFDAFTPGYTGP